MRKIVAIGWNKTGTTSIHRALETLGYRTTSRPWNGRGKGPGPLSPGFIDVCRGIWEAHDAFTDYPHAYLFPLIDQLYPGSKFIHTYRSEDAWIASCRRFYGGGNPTHAFLYAGRERLKDHDSETVWRARYRMHNEYVWSYFSRREGDLLSLNIEEGLGWGPICEFLGREVPEVGFPWENKTRDAA